MYFHKFQVRDSRECSDSSFFENAYLHQLFWYNYEWRVLQSKMHIELVIANRGQTILIENWSAWLIFDFWQLLNIQCLLNAFYSIYNLTRAKLIGFSCFRSFEMHTACTTHLQHSKISIFNSISKSNVHCECYIRLCTTMN